MSRRPPIRRGGAIHTQETNKERLKDPSIRALAALRAARSTLRISAGGIALGRVIATLACAVCLSRSTGLRRYAALCVSLLRPVPLLLQIMVFFALPLIGLDVPAMLVAIGMTEAAILRRILRPPGRRPMIRHAGRFGQGSAVADPSPRNSRVRNSARRRVTGSGSAGP